MTRIAYVNGTYVPQREASVHIEDRGYQFADGVYEVIALQNGLLIDEERHLIRLERSLGELRIAPAMSRRALGLVMRELIARNNLESGSIYLQMTRAVAPRDHPFPANAKTQTVMTVKRQKPLPKHLRDEGVRVITVPDIRWARCDIKSIGLLANVLAKQQAREAGAYEAWMVDSDGLVTEGSSTNAWIVSHAGELVTRHVSADILNGVTRLNVIDIARRLGSPLVERAFSVAEAKAAREAFITSTSIGVLPVSQIDDDSVANGKPGTIALGFREMYEAQYAG
jgi:D-alanine transaminase